MMNMSDKLTAAEMAEFRAYQASKAKGSSAPIPTADAVLKGIHPNRASGAYGPTAKNIDAAVLAAILVNPVEFARVLAARIVDEPTFDAPEKTVKDNGRTITTPAATVSYPAHVLELARKVDAETQAATTDAAKA